MTGRRGCGEGCGEGFGEASGEWSERVTNQNAAMIRPETVAPNRAGWTPMEAAIHTATRDSNTLSDECPQPCQKPSNFTVRTDWAWGMDFPVGSFLYQFRDPS